ncbi:MAG TPA: hypothetical protein DEO40_08410 [Treponema sp.]|nr:hypothetical protein [Treponema sp.]HBB43309.1 hypothetical protein [Treponema sp.]HCA20684.1 hypothetical protein [Treponema sp.]
MNKKTYTALFTIISTIVNIVMTLAIILALIILSSIVYFKLLGKQEPNSVILVVWMVCFFAGLVIGMILFTKICTWVIDRFNLASKLDSRALGHYLPAGKKAEAAMKNEPEKPKTNMPASSLPQEDTWGQSE